MMYKIILYICGLVLTVNGSTLQESLTPPCGIDDNNCIRLKFYEILQYIADNGAPECGIEDPVDPYDLGENNFNVSILGGVDINVYDGYLKGLKGCNFTYSSINFDLGLGVLKAVCTKELKINGDYILTGILQGEGTADISVVDLQLDFLMGVKIVEGDDGLKHLRFNKTFNYNVGDLKFHATDINVGGVDITETGNELIQKNWKVVVYTIGRNIVEEAVNIYLRLSRKSFDCVPAKYIIKEEDLQNVENSALKNAVSELVHSDFSK